MDTQLVNVDEAHTNYTYICDLRKNINASFWQLVSELKKCRENRFWAVLGHETWASYLAQPEIDFNEHTVDYWLTIYNSIKEYQLQWPDIVNDIDQSKLAIIVPYINKDNAEDLLHKAKSLSRSDLRDEIRDMVTPKKVIPLPEGKYDVIYADPPWQYANSGISGAAENHYPTMTIEQMSKLQIPSADNATLFMWITNPLIAEAMPLINNWGFQYKTNMVWVKDIAGQGFYVKGQHELLFICVKGNHRPDDSLYIRSVVQLPRLEHSQKPEKFYEIIETLYPHGKYLELFSRNKREKWTMWGNQ